MPLPSLVVAPSPLGLSKATSSKMQGAAVSRSTWDHMVRNVSGSQEFSFTWIAVILGVTLTLSLSLPSPEPAVMSVRQLGMPFAGDALQANDA